MATLDVCVNKTTPTIFCDEEGYDIIPICIIKVSNENDFLDGALHKQKGPKSDTISE